MTHEKKFNFLLGGLIIAMIVIYFAFGRKAGPNPAALTDSRLQALEEAVIDWAQKQGAPPEKLSDLGLESEALTDHIGNPFIYDVSGTKVTITSFGADSKPGGVMFKADRAVRFDTAAP
ncbi:MAG: hypothetical protein P1V20_12320 [Verrucomicrobiales bacterium]|nr:hypothetical protein [Verrucomicrobiales bacterium]